MPDSVLGQNEITLRLPGALLQKLRYLLKQAPAIAKKASTFPILVSEFQDEVLSIIVHVFANHQAEALALGRKTVARFHEHSIMFVQTQTHLYA